MYARDDCMLMNAWMCVYILSHLFLKLIAIS